MTDDPFAFADVTGPSSSLRALPPSANDRLLARALRGDAPLPAAAELARRGDARAARMLTGAAAFVAPDDLSALAALDGGVDALACVAATPWLPQPTRVAAAEALRTGPVTAASCAALAEANDGPRRVAVASVAAALADVSPRASKAVRDEAERLRSVARQVRDGSGGTIRRQEYQRAIARGELHPVAGALVGDEGEFLAGIVPPVADEARERLLSMLLAVLRNPSEARRAAVLAFLQRRWAPVAASALSALARTPLKAKELAAALAAVKALAAMGALDELTAVCGAATGAVRSAALGELVKATERSVTELDTALLGAALTRAEADGDAAVRALVTKLRGRLAKP